MLVLLGVKVSKCYGFIIPFKLCAGPFFSKSCADISITFKCNFFREKSQFHSEITLLVCIFGFLAVS